MAVPPSRPVIRPAKICQCNGHVQTAHSGRAAAGESTSDDFGWVGDVLMRLMVTYPTTVDDNCWSVGDGTLMNKGTQDGRGKALEVWRV